MQFKHEFHKVVRYFKANSSGEEFSRSKVDEANSVRFLNLLFAPNQQP